MLYCGIIGQYGIEALLTAEKRKFFIAELDEKTYEKIVKLLRANKTEEAEGVLTKRS
jgi:hypothetical protein